MLVSVCKVCFELFVGIDTIYMYFEFDDSEFLPLGHLQSTLGSQLGALQNTESDAFVIRMRVLVSLGARRSSVPHEPARKTWSVIKVLTWSTESECVLDFLLWSYRACGGDNVDGSSLWHPNITKYHGGYYFYH